MDGLLVAERLPKLAERAMRAAIVAAVGRAGRRMKSITPRELIDDALVRFERASMRVAADGIRPALLFAERDRIVRELRTFVRTRLAERLFRVHRRDVLALARDAAPFDAILRGRAGGSYGVVFRRLSRDGRRLETMRAIRSAALDAHDAVRGVLVYDLASGSLRTLRCGRTPRELVAA